MSPGEMEAWFESICENIWLDSNVIASSLLSAIGMLCVTIPSITKHFVPLSLITIFCNRRNVVWSIEGEGSQKTK